MTPMRALTPAGCQLAPPRGASPPAWFLWQLHAPATQIGPQHELWHVHLPGCGVHGDQMLSVRLGNGIIAL